MRRLSSAGRGIVTGVLLAATAPAMTTNDWQFLDMIERANLRFFQTERHGPYKLIGDSCYYDTPVNYPSVGSVAGTGFELTSICLGHYRGWISFSNAYEQVLLQLRGFKGQLSSDPEVLKRVNGWTYHWYNVDTGYQNAPDGLSLLDHSLFIAGCIFVAEYFKGTEAGALAQSLYEETTWSWRPNSDYDFGYSENLLSVVEAAEAPQFKKGSDARTMWESYVEPNPRTLQLYFWEYPHCWVDFRFRWDGKGRNHTEIARDSIMYQRQRAMDMHGYDPTRYDMIGSNVWGWTAASSSEGYHQMAPWGLWLGGVWYDEDRASDSGSVTPIGLPPCMIYAGTETLAALKEIYQRFYLDGWNPAVGEQPVWSDVYGFINCFNKGKPYNAAKTNWFHGINAAIDYGPNVLMLENYKLGSTWRWFMQNTNIAAGMYTLGFNAPQQVSLAAFDGGTNEFAGETNIGGAWNNDATPATIAYIAVSNGNSQATGTAVRIAGDGNREGGWINLGNRDQRAQAQLTFWARCGTGQERVDVGLKDRYGKENKVRLAEYASTANSTNWSEVKIPLERFCMTSVLTNDTWIESASLLSFEFTNSSGGMLDVDHVAFTKDTRAPPTPTNAFGIAQAGSHTRVAWNPSGVERDVIGYHVWRRFDSTSGFVRVTSRLVPAYLGWYEDTSNSVLPGQEVRYAIQAFDNAEPQNSSPFSLEKRTLGGRLDVDWNNGVNPNVFGGTNDGFFGPATSQTFAFVYTNLPEGWNGWARRSTVNAAGSGHSVDLANGSAEEYWALSFSMKGAAGGEPIDVGLCDSDGHERVVSLDGYLEGGTVGTNWTRAVIPLGDFTNVSLSRLRNLSFLHEGPGTVFVASLGFLQGQRTALGEDYFTEGENYTRQYGTTTQDVKAGASAGKVLGWGWGSDGGDFADYEFYVMRPVTNPTVHVRYACNAGNGRALEVRWDDAPLSSVPCTNTAGWGDSSNDFSWATVALPSIASGFHKLTFYANGFDDPVNLDCWFVSDSQSAFRECEDWDSQVGSDGQDLKAGASGGAVLGQSWGVDADSSAVYDGVDAGAQTGAWLHVWYACCVSSGRVLRVYVDGAFRAELFCAPTPGWGEHASHFDRASAFLGSLGGGPHSIRIAVPGAGDGINLDGFYIGPAAPDGLAMDSDADGLSDRQETVAGTSAGAADTDGDGIDDGDEVQSGLGGSVSDPSRADTDADGLNDREERISGTDPWIAADVFQCLEISGTNFPMIGKVLRWPSVTGRSYSVYALTNSLIAGPWSLLTSSLSATPSVNVWTDAADRSPPVFYRVDVRR